MCMACSSQQKHLAYNVQTDLAHEIVRIGLSGWLG